MDRIEIPKEREHMSNQSLRLLVIQIAEVLNGLLPKEPEKLKLEVYKEPEPVQEPEYDEWRPVFPGSLMYKPPKGVNRGVSVHVRDLDSGVLERLGIGVDGLPKAGRDTIEL